MRVIKTIGVVVAIAVTVLFINLITLQLLLIMSFKPTAQQVEIVDYRDLSKGDVELCKQYRQWQALPEIKGAATSMDALCERLGY